jgi:hypothetical protein
MCLSRRQGENNHGFEIAQENPISQNEPLGTKGTFVTNLRIPYSANPLGIKAWKNRHNLE